MLQVEDLLFLEETIKKLRENMLQRCTRKAGGRIISLRHCLYYKTNKNFQLQNKLMLTALAPELSVPFRLHWHFQFAFSSFLNSC